MSAPTDEVPDSVTFREVQEILRTFKDSDWTGMTVELHGMRITVGKQGPPTSAPSGASGSGGTGVPAVEASAAAPVAAAPPAQARAIEAPTRATQAPTRAEPGPASRDLAGCVAVSSPAVGAFWVAPSPGQPPFVAVGDTVAADQQLAIVEVMKLMNPVLAPVAGVVEQVAVANAELVEYEQTLFWIRPSDG
jgi:acetyl-CoA carboxylase biotin carboxyl carrier protein